MGPTGYVSWVIDSFTTDCRWSYLRKAIRHYPQIKEMLAQSSKCAVCGESFLNTWLECVRFVDAREVRTCNLTKRTWIAITCTSNCLQLAKQKTSIFFKMHSFLWCTGNLFLDASRRVYTISNFILIIFLWQIDCQFKWNPLYIKLYQAIPAYDLSIFKMHSFLWFNLTFCSLMLLEVCVTF